MSKNPLIYWHALQKVFVYTPRTFALLLERFNNHIETVWTAATQNDFYAVKAKKEHWEAFVLSRQDPPPLPVDMDLCAWHDPRYPPLLKEIADPPLVLYIQGILPAPITACAIVGTRHPTPYGRHTARKFASSLARAGITIVSGFAYGIDTEAHQTAVDTQGKTIAVLGSSLDCLYPQSNTQLAQKIRHNGGVLLSEYPPGMPAAAFHFPQRNRIIAGLSQAVLVVEAAIDSGSRITARYALEQNRDVFAVPGDITTTTSAGCNELIRTASAQLVTHPDHILEALHIQPVPTTQQQTPQDLPGQIIHFLRQRPCSLADLAQNFKTSVTDLQQTISYLEIEGHITQDDMGYFMVI